MHQVEKLQKGINEEPSHLVPSVKEPCERLHYEKVAFSRWGIHQVRYGELHPLQVSQGDPPKEERRNELQKMK
jgi:hypothetical protein